MISVKQGNLGSVIIEIKDEPKVVGDLIAIMGMERGSTFTRSTFTRSTLVIGEKEKTVVIKLAG